jgi:hypothetical protein
VSKDLYAKHYNGKNNSDFLHYVYSDFAKDNPKPGETSNFHHSDSFKNNNLSISKDDKSIEYRINSDGFRCDDFGTRTSSNFLFAGCSVSFGMGLPYSSTWAYKVNESFNKDNFYNVSVSASSIYTIVNNIISYIKLYGSPEHIFVMFPDYYRVPRFEDNDGEYYVHMNSLYPELGLEHTMFAKHLSINSIITLEFLCLSMGIGLTWSTWYKDFSDELKSGPISKNFNNFLNVIDKLDYNIPNNEKNNPYWKNARDKHHFGEEVHSMIAKVIKNEYSKNN